MRRGTSGAGVHRLDDGRMYGVNLGADFTAEHEWGIKDLQRDFGLDEKAAPGVPRRVIRTVPLRHAESGGGYGGVVMLTVTSAQRGRSDSIVGDSYVVGYTRYGAISVGELRFYADYDKPYTYKKPGPPREEIVGAWSEGDFAVHFKPEHKQDAIDLHDALLAKDVAFLFGNVGGSPFANAGLCLAIVSRLPQGIVDSLREQTEDLDALRKAADKTGIVKDIDALNKAWREKHRGDYSGGPCGYFALSPRWDDREKGTVKFWLNPQDQKHNNFGSFTPAELRLWMKGEGPIPMKVKA